MSKENKENKDTSSIKFYCKECRSIVETRRIGQKYVYICKKCGTKNVAFGTEKSLTTFFRIENVPAEKV